MAEVSFGATHAWSPQRFAGFYYDINEGIGEENIVLTITGGVLEEADGAVYETVDQKKGFRLRGVFERRSEGWFLSGGNIFKPVCG